MHDPDVLILDEPTAGLDPNQIVEVRDLIRRFSERKTIVLSTHILQEVDAMCDHVVVIHNGRIAADTSVPALREEYGDLEKAFHSLTTARLNPAARSILEGADHA